MNGLNSLVETDSEYSH